MCAGKSNEYIRHAMMDRGYPSVCAQTLTKYRNDERAKSENDERLQLARQFGMANRLNRIQRLQERLSQFHHRLLGWTPDPYKPHETIPGPAVTPIDQVFRLLSQSELKIMVELDRLCYPQMQNATVRNREGGLGGTEATTALQSAEPYISLISMQAIYNDVLERYVERTRGKSIEELSAERELEGCYAAHPESQQTRPILQNNKDTGE